MVKKTGCGKNPNGSKTPNQCFKSGIGVGIRIEQKKGGAGAGRSQTTKYKKEDLEKMKKGGLEDLGKRIFKLKNMRKKKKAEIITEILNKQR